MIFTGWIWLLTSRCSRLPDSCTAYQAQAAGQFARRAARWQASYLPLDVGFVMTSHDGWLSLTM
jgi:hypothetical protein